MSTPAIKAEYLIHARSGGEINTTVIYLILTLSL